MSTTPDHPALAPQDPDMMRHLDEQYGMRFVRYVLALPDSWNLGNSVTVTQAEWATTLYQLAVSTEQLDKASRWVNLAALMNRYFAPRDVSFAAYIRGECGGSTEIPTYENDEVATTLVKFASDSYAAFIMKQPEDEWNTGSIVHHHTEQPSMANFCKAVLKDQQLKFLFPSHIESNWEESDFTSLRQVTSLVYFESGQGGSFSLPLLAYNLLNSAYVRCIIYGDDSYDAYIKMVSQALADARKMAAGRSAKIPVALGLSNLSLSEVDRIPLPNGFLRKVTEEDKYHLPPRLAVDALLILETPLRIAVKTRHPDTREDENPETWERVVERSRKWNSSLQWDIDCHHLAFMLANSANHRAAAIEISRAIVNPLHATPHLSWRDERVQTAAAVMEVGPESREALRKWVDNVTSRHPRTLRIAMRRILSASTSRTDPSDSLVDAVLAWENMFSDSPETTLRVCGALSLLLQPNDRESRKALNRELTGIYGTRSAIVHGNANEPAPETVRSHGDRALEVAVQAMRQLHENPHLLNYNNSSARGKDVLLGLVDIR
ncbi:HEPN domain-containing protein [Streptomyces aurantiacus]|nr:HEPN domain-containing protein [Streptomyces aurantiacus]